jgi:uncharacterized Zn finger protein (UPF0148 family)
MSGIDLDDDGKCHFKKDGETGCGTLIYEEDSQRCYGYESDYFIGTDSFKFCPICGKEARILWKEPAYIAKQFELEEERKEKEKVKKEKERKRQQAEIKKEKILKLEEEIKANKLKIECIEYVYGE